jgi:glycosyltransferase involved in cell wall biosynthesis
MRLLFYVRPFAPSIGGVETYAMLLARGLAKKGGAGSVAVTIVTETPANGFDDSALPFTVVRRPGFARLWKLVRSSDVVHLAGPVLTPLFLAVLLRKPIVVEHHGYQANCPNGLLLYEPTRSPCPGHYMQRHYRECLRCNAAEAGWFTSLRRLMLMAPRRWLCSRADVNLCITEHVKLRVQLPRSLVVYYGVPAPPAAPVTVRGSGQPASPRSFSVAPLSVAYVGRLVHEKGVPTLIEAVRRVRQQGYNVSLKIIGDGPQRQTLEAMVGKNNDGPYSTQFTGSLQEDALHAALQDAAVVVIPSLNEEPAGLVVMEQMIAGRPVIVTNHGGAQEIAAEAALTFPPGDAVALAACLRRLVDEPALLSELQAKVRNRSAAMFSEQRMIDEHLKVFESVAKKK